jgi:E3 ubiquitin-protein ligase TRIP12
LLLQVYSTSAGPGVRHSCIQAFLRMVYHSSQELLLQVLSVQTVSSQIAGMLSSGDLKIIVGALQLSELQLQKMPEQFGVHFRREGVLHQVQKLTDPDNPICLSQYNESPLSASASANWGTHGGGSPLSHHHHGGHSGLPGGGGRTWTVSGSSLANMFPDQLRVPKRRDAAQASPAAAASASGATASSLAIAGPSSASATSATLLEPLEGSGQAPLRLSDMLKRKRVSKRPSNRKGRHSDGDLTTPISTPGTSAGQQLSSSPLGGASAAAAASAYDMSAYSSSPPSDSALGPSTPSRRSRIADRTSSLLSQLHPSRWVKSSSGGGGSGSGVGANADGSGGRKDSSPSAAAAASLLQKSVSSPAAVAHSKEKAKRWVREQASRFLESYFKESLGSRHPALTILRRLSAQVCPLIFLICKFKTNNEYFKVDHLTRKPKDGERSLREILSVLHENDISPFEVTQSGLVPSLLTYLTKDSLVGHEEITREARIRTFLHVFLGCPKSADSEESPDPEAVSKFQMFVQKMNACVNHLEQFPIKMHDMTSGSSGVKSAGSTLRFFKTHHLKCSLQRHPDCSSLKMWKGGLVKIDPLALVQAIER